MSDADVIARYLDDLARGLRVGPRHKTRILAEVEDHLHDAVRAEQERGASPEEAMHTAIARFGAPGVVARQFMADLATSGVRGAARALFAALVALGISVEITSPVAREIFGPESRFTAPPGPWPGDVPPWQLQVTNGIATLAFGVAIVAILFALVQTHLWRRGIRIVYPEVQLHISQRGMEGAALGAAVLATGALLVAIPVDALWTFQRAAEVPGSPTPGVLAFFAALRVLIFIAAVPFVVRAVRWAGAAAQHPEAV
jgi:hypothetical protein